MLYVLYAQTNEPRNFSWAVFIPQNPCMQKYMQSAEEYNDKITHKH